ncbi:hypothetical protein [Sporosarcina limicola]|uniref:DNA repair exonuclease SbcCD nuclease subunit n=1 Tax=Sporosarcina limicola TaxID=34101 RepID=A0A927R6I5_9BACL|nr:hypothetical protein [Sporosarcina limicola]MBE1555014.1 DNA repair exonuclease SbcCD nuclease subunit [Sporosarcina limicola]
MIYVNELLVTEEKSRETAVQLVTEYLATKKLVLISGNNEILNEEEIRLLITEQPAVLKLTALHSNEVLRDFKEELHNYIVKIEEYVEDTRESENFTSAMNSFVQVAEALLEFEAVANYLRKKLINHQQIQAISTKALSQAEEGDSEYILDLIEYELLPILHQFIDETNEEM